MGQFDATDRDTSLRRGDGYATSTDREFDSRTSLSKPGKYLNCGPQDLGREHPFTRSVVLACGFVVPELLLVDHGSTIAPTYA